MQFSLAPAKQKQSKHDNQIGLPVIIACHHAPVVQSIIGSDQRVDTEGAFQVRVDDRGPPATRS